MPADEARRFGMDLPATERPRRGHVQVTYAASIPRTTRGGETRILQVVTERQAIAVYVSPTGRLRVFDDQRGEWVPHDPITPEGRRRIEDARPRSRP